MYLVSIFVIRIVVISRVGFFRVSFFVVFVVVFIVWFNVLVRGFSFLKIGNFRFFKVF